MLVFDGDLEEVEGVISYLALVLDSQRRFRSRSGLSFLVVVVVF